MRNGFAPKFPFTIDRNDSDYVLVNNTEDLVRQNLINLLLTSPGERIMDPEFGVGIRRFLFENNTPNTLSNIKNSIDSQVKKYMPFVGITNVLFNTSAQNQGYLGIIIVYNVSLLQTDGSLQLTFNISNRTLVGT
jgi:phage baseplate assembly protein W